MIADHKGEIPVVILLLPFLAGICTGIYFIYAEATWLMMILSLLTAVFVILNIGYSKLSIYKIKWLGGLLALPILFLAGWLITIQRCELNNTDHFSKKASEYLLIHINSEPKVKGNMVSFTAAVKQNITNGKTAKVSGTLLINIKDEIARNLFYGEELLIPAQYNAVEPPHNPGEFNYKRYLANRNVYYQAYLYPRQYVVVKAGYGNPIITYALQLRQNLVKKLQANMHDSTAIAVASTLILGYKADLSNDVLQAYSKTGTIHILSVSGGHVAIIYILLSRALSFLNGYRRGRVIKAVTIITLIWVYALLTGFSPAVNRAALMISMVIVGKTYSRYINTLNILAFSAFVLLLYDPFLLTDVGFQLSYLAVAGLVVFQPIVYKWFSFKKPLPDKLWQACSVSIAAQVITFPLSAFYFHQFPVYFLISNLLIIIPITLIMYTGLLLLVLPQIPVLSASLGFILEKSILYMNKALSYIEHAPYASLGKIWLNTPEHILLYIIIISFFYLLYDKKKTWLLQLALGCLLLFAISIGLKKINADETSTITFLNLRKNTGIIFKDGGHGVVLTNLADTDKAFRYAVQPALDSMRITNYQIIAPDKDIRLAYFVKQNNLVQFLNKKVLLLNHEAVFRSIPLQTKIDLIYVSDNLYIDPEILTNRTLVLNAGNSDAYIRKLMLATKNIPVNCKLLRRNNSLSISSK